VASMAFQKIVDDCKRASSSSLLVLIRSLGLSLFRPPFPASILMLTTALIIFNAFVRPGLRSVHFFGGPDGMISLVFAVTLWSHRLHFFQLYGNQSLPAEIGQLTHLQELWVRCH